MSAQQEYKELYAKYKAAIDQLSTVTAERDRANERIAKADQALIGMVEQYLHWGNRDDGTPFYHHSFMSAGEYAFYYLEENGLAKVNGKEELEFVNTEAPHD